MSLIKFTQKDNLNAVIVRFDTRRQDVNDFFLADTEESDGPEDVEMARADFRCCVKCKDKQTNRMYRYCERCYKVSILLYLHICYNYHD